jgi:hypothetical protein
MTVPGLRDLARLWSLIMCTGGGLLRLSVLETVFSINGRSIKIGKQPALCLGEMQVDGPRLATGSQKLPDIVHLGVRLVLRWKPL